MHRPALAIALLSLLLCSVILSQAPANRAEAPAQRFAVSPGSAVVAASLPTCIGAPAVPGDSLASFLQGFEAVRARALATGRPTCLAAVADGPELENLIGTLNALRVAGQSVQIQPRSLQIDTIRREVDGTLTVTAQISEVRRAFTARGLAAGAALRDDRTVLFKLRPVPAQRGSSGLTSSASGAGSWLVVDDAMPPEPALPADLTGAYAQALTGVVNRSTALALADSATGSNLIRLIAANGFAIHPQSIVPDFFTDTGLPGDGPSSGLYARNAAEAIPSLITIDSALHVYHVLQGRVQVSAELTVLPARLQAFLGDLLEVTASQRGRISGALAADALRRNAIYLAVSELLAGGSWPAGTLSVDEAALAAREANLIRTHLGRAVSPVLGRVVDYGQFAPHGHYAMGVTLTGYAQALEWLRVAGPALGASRIVSLQAVLLGLALRQQGAHGSLMGQWQALAAPISAFAGVAATQTVPEFEGVLTSIYGAEPSGAAAGDTALLAHLVAAAPARSRLSLLPVPEQPDMALVAGKAPSGLEVLSALGSTAARGLESTGAAAPPLTPDGSSLYGGGLALLRDLAASAPAGAPAFMHGGPWGHAALASALGWWSEMHQDPQPLAGLLDRVIASSEQGGLQVARPNYVEPVPLAWKALAGLAAQLSALSSSAQLLDGLQATDAVALQAAEQRFGQMVTQLGHIADDELAGRPVADADAAALQDPDRTLGAIALAAERHAQGPVHLAGSQSAALAEIAGRLEAGEGPPQELWALVEIGGSRYLARGAVYSYYEFAAAPRAISDATWQTGGWAQRLQPQWTAVYER